MLAEKLKPASQAGEDQASPEFAARAAYLADAQANLDSYWSKYHPGGASSLGALAKQEQMLRPGDVVYVSEVHRHILTEDDLNEAARSVAGGQSCAS